MNRHQTRLAQEAMLQAMKNAAVKAQNLRSSYQIQAYAGSGLLGGIGAFSTSHPDIHIFCGVDPATPGGDRTVVLNTEDYSIREDDDSDELRQIDCKP